ncbi:hypothetical protein EHE19_001810 [Ruminiclostridium herbifermentans]|uniref:CBM3 domain-containing protein n=1 Tax=Ruminiclostridium herbifermentans TaxID=2488810 RepID=A0A7H1VPI9_9FIRM|nr:cohesin domain-containing protein [Ruminiclostridium herbifermentans]QNU67301.1 hypothetical protein EHE19_001810 [Ruminiclostridium herbifermentans]
MLKKKILCLIALLMALSVFTPRLYAQTAGDLQILFNNNGNASTSSNTINANFKVINNGSSSIDLADLKLRYYYTADSDTPQNFFCDHAGMLNGWTYTGVTDKVTGTFGKLSPAVAKADSYFEVGFKDDAGTLSAGGYIEIQTRVARNDWTNYDMSNDYSFMTLNTYGDNDKISAYMKGVLIYGGVTNISTSTITPTVFTYDKYTSSDVTITLLPFGNAFKGIVGLTEGEEYSLSGNIVTLKEEYLNSLPIGNIKLTFDFGETNNPELTLTVKDTTPKVLFDAKIGTATGLPGDTVTVPITFENVARASKIGSLYFYISYDNTLLEAVSIAPGSIVPNPVSNFATKIDSSKGQISFIFLDVTIGDEMIESDGDFAQMTFRIKSTAPAITTPVKFDEKAYAMPGSIESMANTYNGSVVITIPDYAAISPSSATFDKGAPEDVIVTVESSGYTFNGITGLTNGTDYTISGNTVTILKEYLNTLPKGTKELTFDFGAAKNPKLTLTIKDTRPKPSFDAIIGTAVGLPGESVTIPVSFENVAEAGYVGMGDFLIGYDNTLLEAISVVPGSIVTNPAINFSSKIESSKGLISLVFLDYTIGNELIKTDGDFALITFKIKNDAIATTTPLEFKPLEFGSGANTINGSITIKSPEIEAPKITPTSASYIYGSASDIIVTLTPNGNVFKGISGLTKGVDYIVSGDTVTLLKSYLNKLPTGTKMLTFDFGLEVNPTLKLTTEMLACPTTVGIGTVYGAPGDIVTVPITISGVRNVGGVGTFNIYVGYDKTLLEAVSVEPGNVIINPNVNFSSRIDSNTGKISAVFLDNTIGDELILSDGIIMNMTFKVLKAVGTSIPIVFNDGGVFGDWNFAKIRDIDFHNGSIMIYKTIILNVSAGKVTGQEGEIVSVPISFDNVTEMNNVMACDFKVGYDSNLLEAVSVEPGSIVTNAGVDFTADISAASGVISLFINSTEDSQSISEDGVFANINFRLKTPSAAEVITPVEIKEIGDFTGLNLNQIAINKTNGSVTIIRTTVVESQINPSNTSFVIGSTDSLKITLTPNGNTFNGISGLRQGTDYTVSGNTVTIRDSYLRSLEVGIFKLTFDFGIGEKNPVLEITVNAGTPAIYPNYRYVFIDDLTNLDINIAPNGNTFYGIIGLTEGTDYTVSGNSVTILTNYLAKLSLETKELTFDFGMQVNPVLTIYPVIGERFPLDVKVGNVTGIEGDIVTVPITLSHVKDVNNVGTFNFYVDYDKNLLKAVSVEPGDIITNPITNFSSLINANNGFISFVFLDYTIGDEIITTDGVLANITFKILGTSGTTAPLVFRQGGAFGNENMAKINSITFTNGSVTIDNTSKLKISIGDVTGNEGEVVSVPISFENVAQLGNIEFCDFKVAYDANLLEAISVEPGSIVTNANDNFNSYINTTDGVISFLFLDNTAGSELINTDGVFANINFKLKNPSEPKITTPVTIQEIGTIGGPNLNMMPINKISGSVTVIRTTSPEYKINPSTASFVLGSTDNLQITLIPNGDDFFGIPLLLYGTDYIVSGNTVTISKDYLNSLNVGIKELTFDFVYSDKDPVLEIEIKKGTPSISPTNKNMYINAFTDISVNITPNGNTFKGIVGLTKGIDYTVAGNKVTILKSYVDSLEIGTKELTFDFGIGVNNPVFNINVKPGIPSISPNLATVDKYNFTSLFVNITPNGNTFKGIVGLTEGVDYTVSGNTVTILKSYIDTLQLGLKTLIFDFGIANNSNLNLNVIDSGLDLPLKVSAGMAQGYIGQTVTIPIIFTKVVNAGNIGTCNFYLVYDPSKVEVVSVNAGPIVKSSAINFSSRVDAAKGKISFVFLDNTIGDELIKEDGIFASVTFKIIGGHGTTVPIILEEGGAFGDAVFSKINNVIREDGLIIIN